MARLTGILAADPEALAAHRRQPRGSRHWLLSGGDRTDREWRDIALGERHRARLAQWLQDTGGVGLPPAGAPVVVVCGALAGERGKVVRTSGHQVRVRLLDGREVRPLREFVRFDGETR